MLSAERFAYVIFFLTLLNHSGGTPVESSGIVSL